MAWRCIPRSWPRPYPSAPDLTPNQVASLFSFMLAHHRGVYHAHSFSATVWLGVGVGVEVGVRVGVGVGVGVAARVDRVLLVGGSEQLRARR